MVREIARPDDRALGAATERHAHGDLALLHDALAIGFRVTVVSTAVLRNEQVVEIEIDVVGVQIRDACIADGREYPAEVWIRGEERRLHERRMRDGIRDLTTLLRIASTFDANRDELRRTFAVANDRLRKLCRDICNTVAKSTILGALSIGDFRDTTPTRRDKNE